METVIALSILAIGLTFSSALIANSLRNISVSKNRVIAVNIAREGIEAVRNIRDTNWLKFSGRRRLCWNHMPQDITPPTPETCSGLTSELILADEYVVYKADDHRWRLSVTNPTVDKVIVNAIPLYTVDIDEKTDTDGNGNNEDDADMYNHIYTSADDALGRTRAKETPFSRTITIEYLKDNGDPGDSNNNRMRVTCTVKWIRGGAEHTVQLKTTITDYLGREDLGS